MNEFVDHPLNERLGLLVSMWTEKLRFAREAKREFDVVADQCRMFYENSQKFWDDSKTRGSYIKDSRIHPNFNMTICKAFEMVALFGPLLYWRNPQRHVKARKPLPVVPELFDPPPEMLNQPPQPGVPPQQAQQQIQQMIRQFQQQTAQQIGQQQQQDHSLKSARAELLEQVLNWLPGQQSGGGLASHSRRAITDALLTGRGCLWTSLYQHPGSDSMLCGSFYDPVENLLIDPDSVMPDMSDAYWIARIVVEPVWVVERKFDLPRGSLKGNMHSGEGLSEADSLRRLADRMECKTQDLLEYAIIYSKAGIGRRFKAGKEGRVEFQQEKLLRKIDEAGGGEGAGSDFVHLAIASGVPFPLNLPGQKLEKMSTPELQQALKWPIEFWRESGWPVQVIDFYEATRSPWPIAPLKPAMGELVFLNIMLSAMAERAWNSSEDLIGVAMDKFDAVVDAIEQKGGRKFIKLDGIRSNINEAVQFLQGPQVNYDVWRMIDRVIELFEQRTGLTDMLQGMVKTQDRSAEATATRREQMNLRPDDMSAKVEAWMTRVASSERIAVKTYVTGQSLRRLLGDYGSWLWDKLMEPLELEDVLRDVDVTIEAGSARKPNKQREVANLEQVTPLLMPVLQNYMQVTTDTKPVMWLISRVADALELDLAGLQLGQMVPPPPPPQVQQQQQAEQQAAQQQQQMEMAAKQADVQAKQTVAAQKIQQAQVEHAMKMRELEADAQKNQMDAMLEQQESQSRMSERAMEARIKQEEMMQRLAMLAAEAQMKREQMAQPTAPMMQEAI